MKGTHILFYLAFYLLVSPPASAVEASTVPASPPLIPTSTNDFSDAISGTGGPTLDSTMSWMDYTYNPRPSSGSFGHGNKEIFDPSSNANLFSRTMETFTYKDCLLVLNIQDDPNSTLSGVHAKSTQTFDMRSIDPKSIQVHTFDSHQNGEECRDPEVVASFHMNCDTAEIQFTTRNQAPLIDVEAHAMDPKLHGSDQDVVSKTKESNGLFEVNNADYAKRFAHAFAHAIDLCSRRP